jgi:hypothetical protein
MKSGGYLSQAPGSPMKAISLTKHSSQQLSYQALISGGNL